MALKPNVSGDSITNFCGWCDNSGWVYLRAYHACRIKVLHKTKGPLEVRYADQVLAPCIVCEEGDRRHRRYPGLPVQYRLEDVDVSLDEHQILRLPPDQAERYRKLREVEGRWYRTRADEDKTTLQRAEELALSDEAPDILEYMT